MAQSNITKRAALPPKEAAKYVGLSTTTLSRMRANGTSIAYIKMWNKNNKVLCPIKELDAFLAKTQKVI